MLVAGRSCSAAGTRFQAIEALRNPFRAIGARRIPFRAVVVAAEAAGMVAEVAGTVGAAAGMVAAAGTAVTASNSNGKGPVVLTSAQLLEASAAQGATAIEVEEKRIEKMKRRQVSALEG